MTAQSAGSLTHYASKRSAISQVLDQILNTAKVLAQQCLLLLRGKRLVSVGIGTLLLRVGIECAGKLAWAAL